MLNKKTFSERIIFIIIFVLFAIYAFTLIYPFLWLFINSFKMDVEFRANSFALPKRWIFANYFDAITYVHKGYTIFNMFINSVINVVIIVVSNMFFQCCTAYVLSKYKFRFRKMIYNVALIIMVVPSIGSTAATFNLWHDIGIYDNYISILIMGASGFGSGFLLLYATFANLSWTYAEAGFIDGASHFKVFIKIMMPQVMPVMVSLMIITAIGVWNDYYTPYMYMPSYPTIAVGLFEIQANAMYKQQFPLFFSLMIISIIPVLLIFILMQNTIMQNVTAGGIKG